MRFLCIFVAGWLGLLPTVTFAMDNGTPRAFNFEHSYLDNANKIQEAYDFFSSNTKNVVLVVEDNETLRFGLQAKLQKRGYAVFTLTNGDDLLTILRKNLCLSMLPNSRLIILDNQMPGTLGLDVMVAITKEALFKGEDTQSVGNVLPVILNSDGYTEHHDPEKLKLFSKVLSSKNNLTEIETILKNSPFRRKTI